VDAADVCTLAIHMYADEITRLGLFPLLLTVKGEMPRPTIPERSLSKYKVTKQKMEGLQLSVTH